MLVLLVKHIRLTTNSIDQVLERLVGNWRNIAPENGRVGILVVVSFWEKLFSGVNSLLVLRNILPNQVGMNQVKLSIHTFLQEFPIF